MDVPRWRLCCCLLVVLWIGTEAQYTCHCKYSCPAPTSIFPPDSCPEGCAPDFFDPHCQTKNVARGKRAWQISTYSEDLRRVGPLVKKNLPNTADKAVDGNANTFYSRRSCTHTGLSETEPYWTVDLEREFTVYKIIIYQRSTLTERLTGFEVLVDEQICFRWGSMIPPPIRTALFCETPINGRNVTVRLPRKPDNRRQILTLCEVLVLACNDYWYGERCNMTCNCRDPLEVCHPVTGHCSTGCRSGFTGNDCNQLCPAGRWGEDCQGTCGHCQGDSTCLALTGECVTACQSGWEGKVCDQRKIGNGSKEGPELVDTTSEDGGHLSSGDIAAIFFAVILAIILAVVGYFAYRRWRQWKSATPNLDNRYDDLRRRQTTAEHLYVGMDTPTKESEVKVTGSEVKDTGSEVKITGSRCTMSDDHYEYMGSNDGYLEPLSNTMSKPEPPSKPCPQITRLPKARK